MRNQNQKEKLNQEKNQDNQNEIAKYYRTLVRAVELIKAGDFNGLWILSKPGLGKTYMTDITLGRLKADYIVFRGEVSEPRFFEFLQENANKIIVFRDVAKLLRRLSVIDTLKALTEPRAVRKISRLTYAEHSGVAEEFEFKGRIIFEINDITKSYKEDLNALFERGLFVEFNPSFNDIVNIMSLIAQTKEDKEVTSYVIKNAGKLGSNFNLRTQERCLKVYKAAIRDKRNWRDEVDLFLSSKEVESRKMLYKVAGNKLIIRMDFVKYLMGEKGWSYATCQRRIQEYLWLGDIFSDGKLKHALLSLSPFKRHINISNISDISKKIIR